MGLVTITTNYYIYTIMLSLIKVRSIQKIPQILLLRSAKAKVVNVA